MVLGMRRVKVSVVQCLAPVSSSVGLQLGHKFPIRAETDFRPEWRGEFDGVTSRPLDPGSVANSQPRPIHGRIKPVPLMRDNAGRPRLVRPTSVSVAEKWE
jgi:hypothetical protein